MALRDATRTPDDSGPETHAGSTECRLHRGWLARGTDTTASASGRPRLSTTCTSSAAIGMCLAVSRTAGASIGFHDRFELSSACQRFNLGRTAPGAVIEQDVVGAKLKLYGDAVFGQDRYQSRIAPDLRTAGRASAHRFIGVGWQGRVIFLQTPP